MRNLRALFTATTLLVLTGIAQAAVIDEADWTLKDLSKAPVNWTLTGTARLALNPGEDPLVTLRLLEDRNDQKSAAWHNMQGHVDSFTFMADVRIRTADPNGCPADGLALVFANVADPKTIIGGSYSGTGGGQDLGIFEGKKAIPDFIGFELNLWRDQGLGTAAEKADCPASGKNETFAFDVVTGGNTKQRNGNPADAAVGGAKIGQTNPPTGMRIVNGGSYRYQWNVDGATNTMTLFVTGLDASNKQFQKVKVLEQKIGVPVLGFDGRFGMTGATGGAHAQVDVGHTIIAVPMIP
jgi:hypothetical protein